MSRADLGFVMLGVPFGAFYTEAFLLLSPLHAVIVVIVPPLITAWLWIALKMIHR